MNTVNTNEKRADNSMRKNKFWNILKKVLDRSKVGGA